MRMDRGVSMPNMLEPKASVHVTGDGAAMWWVYTGGAQHLGEGSFSLLGLFG